MKRTFKLIASRSNEIVFDDRVLADSPRDARNEMKKALGLESLSGIVYSITEVPVALIREIVDARLAELAGGESLDITLPEDIKDVVLERLTALLSGFSTLGQTSEEPAPTTRFEALACLPEPAATTEEPDWNLVKRHFRRYGDPAKTAAKYGIDLAELNARAETEGWAA
jgi:hypothetical protein